MSRNVPLRLLLVGKSGAGKSATGNTILHVYAFKADASGKSVTQSTSTFKNTVCGRQVEVTDSPGLFDTTNNVEASKEIVKGLVATNPGPHAVLYVISTAGGRYDEQEYNAFLRAKRYLGERVTDYMIVIFTHGDVLQKKKSLEQWLESASQYLNDVVQACGGRYVLFNNEAATGENPKQVAELLRRIDRLPRSHYIGSPYAGMAQAEIDEELAKRRQQEDKREVESNPHGKKITQNLTQETNRRVVSEKERIAAQKERDDKEKERVAAVNQRIAAEHQSRIALQKERDDKEKERVAAVKQRFAAKLQIIAAQMERDNEKEERVAAEHQRIAAQKERDDIEKQTIAAEKARKRNKATSIVGAVLGAGAAVGGIALAPFTAGASLAITAAGTAALGLNVKNAVDNSD